MKYNINWDQKNDNGDFVPSGKYEIIIGFYGGTIGSLPGDKIDSNLLLEFNILP